MSSRILALGTVAMMAVAPVSAWAADHREAPRISELPAADLNDLYVFQPEGKPGRVVLVLTVNPLSEPDFAGTYAFSPRVVYRFLIDSRGGPAPDKVIRMTFSDPARGPQRFRVRLPDGTRIEGLTTPGTVLSTEASEPIIAEQGDVQVFAGARDDPFFFDGVGFNRFVAGVGGFSGTDSFAGHNVSAIVIELPFSRLAEGDSINVYADTLDRRRPFLLGPGRRLDRTAVPGLATAFIPLELRDAFNRGVPRNDERDYAAVIVESLEALGTPDENIEILARIAIPDQLTYADGPDGFPNGRRLEDDVIDTIVSVVLASPDAGDGVDMNDKEFLEGFPYLAAPHQAH